MENSILPHMVIHGMYIYIDMCRSFITRRVHGRFYGLDGGAIGQKH